jgi:hypothetical protein
VPLCTVIGRCVSAAVLAGPPVSAPCTTDAGRDPARQPRHVDLCPNAQTHAGDCCMLGCVGRCGSSPPVRRGRDDFPPSHGYLFAPLALRTLPNSVHDYVRSGYSSAVLFWTTRTVVVIPGAIRWHAGELLCRYILGSASGRRVGPPFQRTCGRDVSTDRQPRDSVKS